MARNDGVSQIPTLLENLFTATGQAAREIDAVQLRQKRDLIEIGTPCELLAPGELVLIENQHPATGASQIFAKPL
nr:unnamed protein product [Callosobruchus analis]